MVFFSWTIYLGTVLLALTGSLRARFQPFCAPRQAVFRAREAAGGAAIYVPPIRQASVMSHKGVLSK